ncbi:hypothetical protein L3X38_042059 [Prunus dulcis]|uniref:Uncharacterized protein n=1 Tax=Prunus dulcis TaxID=3755 RepID=A0AAD4UTU8_PRUDU|nr:hypothetical protein L3X38_042059 [Prunus dulcis]
MVDSRNYFSSWRVSFKKASEVNSVVNFIRELVKVFNFQTRDPEFGFTESFKAWWGKISATWFSQPSEVHMEKIFWGCACSSTYYSFKNFDPIFETKVGGQTATSKAEVETEVIGANLSTNPDVVMTETQQVIKPSGNREVDCRVIDDPSHIPNHQEMKVAILAEVSEDIRSYGPLEAQLRQDSVAVKLFEARKLPIISALSARESACEYFRIALRSCFLMFTCVLGH